MKGSSSAALRRVLKYIQRRWPLLALSILLAAASVAGTLYVPILIGDAIDCIAGPGEVDFQTIAALLGRIAAANLHACGKHGAENCRRGQSPLQNKNLSKKSCQKAGFSYNMFESIRRDKLS